MAEFPTHIGTAFNQAWDAVSPGAGIRKIAYNNPGRGCGCPAPVSVWI